jgi:Lon-like ATP-dependent protease
LEALDVQERLEMVLDLIQIEDDLKRVKNKTTENMRRALFENQNKAFFREFINQFKQVAGLNEKGSGGGGEGGGDKISRYLAKAKALHFTPEAQEAFDYELDKLRGQHENSSESYVIEKYLDWLVSVPWGIYLHDLFNLRKAKHTLEQDHYGLEDVKQRILEFISMGRILGNVDGKILCLVGPPGTGKTLIAKLIAESLNRKYVRIAMGGVQDMHELKGHRRTYVGAVPGRIILALKQAKTLNPLMLIDEIDKLDTTLRSGGGALLAFLEILDPEQNHSFIDNYLDVKVDLSKVLFVCTANYLGNIPPPLRDRMEVIEVSGYTTNEKVEITKRHLIPQAAKKAGLEGGKVEIPDRTIVRLIERYCRESGLRNVKKQIGRIFSKAAFKIVEEVENKDEAEAKASPAAKAEAEASPAAKAEAEASPAAMAEAEAIDKVKSETEAEAADATEKTNAATATDETASGPPSVGAGPKKRKKKDASASLSADIAAKREALEKDLEIAPEEEAPPPPLVIPDSVKIVVTPEVLKDYIGPEIYPKDRVYETLPAGVATGLSYSGLGNGDALYIESILTNSIGSGTGHAGVRVTGSLKDVMKELASISYSFAKLFMTKRFPKNRFFEAADIHVHCPDGAIPKDGPSAGISFTTSLVSLALNQPIAGNIAMTGELTVTGRVLAVGGLREKILGAKRYGCDTIIFPRDIENTLEDIPAEVKDGVKLIPVEWYHEVFDLVFPGVSQDQGNRVWEEEFSALDSRRKKEKK